MLTINSFSQLEVYLYCLEYSKPTSLREVIVNLEVYRSNKMVVLSFYFDFLFSTFSTNETVFLARNRHCQDLINLHHYHLDFLFLFIINLRLPVIRLEFSQLSIRLCFNQYLRNQDHQKSRN